MPGFPIPNGKYPWNWNIPAGPRYDLLDNLPGRDNETYTKFRHFINLILFNKYIFDDASEDPWGYHRLLIEEEDLLNYIAKHGWTYRHDWPNVWEPFMFNPDWARVNGHLRRSVKWSQKAMIVGGINFMDSD